MGAEAVRFPPAVQPISVVGVPALAWDGTSWVIVWRDTRRLGSAQAQVYAATWDGGLAVNPPTGFLVTGASSSARRNDLLVASSAAFTLVVFEQPTDAGVDLVGVPTSGSAAVTGTWGAPLDLNGGRLVSTSSAAVAASRTQALVAWLGGGAINLVTVPGLTRNHIDAGPNVTSLSVGDADGGFLVTWVDGSTRGLATLVDPVTLVPGVADQLSAIGTTAVRAVSRPAQRLATTHRNSGALQLHAFTGSFWTSTTWPSTASGSFAPLTTATTGALVSVSRSASGNFVIAAPHGAPAMNSAPVLFSLAPVLPVALAQSGTHAMALVVDDARVSGQPFIIESNPVASVVVPPPIPLLSAPLRQRAPSAVWVDQEQAFLVAWDEEHADGGSVVMSTWVDPRGQARPGGTPITGVPTFPLGARPILLRRPSGTAYGVQLRSTVGGQRAVFDLNVSSSASSVGPQRTSARTLDWAIRGNAVDLQWGRVLAATGGFVDLEATTRFTFAGAPPTCAAALSGKLVLASHEPSGLTVAFVPDAPTGVTLLDMPQLVPVVGTQGPVCTTSIRVQTVGGPRDDLALSWRDGNEVVLHTMTVSPLVNVEWAVSGQPGSDPVVVDTSTGPVVVWIGARGVDAVALRGGALSPVTSLGGGLDIDNLSVAASPVGLAAVVWDAFLADAGARQVMMRLVGVFDGGVSAGDGGVPDAGPVDAGLFGDAGVISDAGVIGDAGVISDAGATSDGGVIMPGDAGASDAGAVDAGVRDAGALDAGLMEPVDAGATDAGVPPVALSFVPACGCQGAPGVFSVLLALVLLRRRVAR